MLNKNNEVLEMQEVGFVQKHYKKILFGAGVAVAAGTYYMLKKHDMEISDISNKLRNSNAIALRSLYREKADAEFEINALKEYANNLDESYNINKFCKIPEALSRVAELETFVEEIINDIEEIKHAK